MLWKLKTGNSQKSYNKLVSEFNRLRSVQDSLQVYMWLFRGNLPEPKTGNSFKMP